MNDFSSLGRAHGGAHDAQFSTDTPDTLATVENVLARLMVERAMPATPGLAEALRQGASAIVVEVPSEAWIRPITAEFHRLMTVNREPEQGPPPPDIDQEGEDAFAAVDQMLGLSEQPRPTRWLWVSDPRPNADIGRTLAEGNGVIAVTHSSPLLPRDLRRAADFHAAVPPPDWSMVAEAIAIVSGRQPTEDLSDQTCRTLAPGDLRLACRPAEDADQWVERLRRLAETAQVPRTDGPLLDDLHGMDEVRTWATDLIQDLNDYAAGTLPWSSVDRGCLLHGAPGTGKTTVAAAIARSAGLPLVTASHSEWQSAGHQGQMLAAMRATFDRARALAPCILFIDEIDGFPDRRTVEGRNRDYLIQVVNALLELLDGVDGRPGVVVVAACNNPHLLDPALTRAGRLDRAIHIPLPGHEALVGILRYHLEPDTLPDDCLAIAAEAGVNLEATGADCELWVRSARRLARRAGRALEPADLLAQVPRPPVMSAELARRVAVHEAGHALAAALESPGSLLAVSIRPGWEAAGGALCRPPEIGTASEILARIRVLLAGRAAEELLLGAGTTGAGGAATSDLGQATALAAAMTASYGLDGGLTWMGEITAVNVADILAAHPALAARVESVLTEQYRLVCGLVASHRLAVEAVAALLQQRETLDGVEIETAVAAAMSERETAP